MDFVTGEVWEPLCRPGYPLLEEWSRYIGVEPLCRVAMVTRDFGTAVRRMGIFDILGTAISGPPLYLHNFWDGVCFLGFRNGAIILLARRTEGVPGE